MAFVTSGGSLVVIGTDLVIVGGGSEEYGDGYIGGGPSGLRVLMAVGSDLEVLDVGDSDLNGVYVDRSSIRIERVNDDGAAATASFDLIVPQGSFFPVPSFRYVAIDNPERPNGLGGYTAYFAGFTMQPGFTTDNSQERRISVRCVDYAIRFRKPPKQITTQWPFGNGTPVVDTTVAASITSPTVSIVVTPASMRDIYVGKYVFALNSDGSHEERVLVRAVTDTTFTADYATTKTSSTTTVATALHATGSQVITPASMTNIAVGSVLYCYQVHGSGKRDEYVVVTAVTGTTFTAVFTQWKDHDWVVENNWQVIGGITDKQLIADGWKQHVDNDDGTTTLVDVPSLLDYCFNNVGVTMDKTGVDEVILSLPHSKFEGMSPEDVLNWAAQQNPDKTKDPKWYGSFVQPTTTAVADQVLTMMCRWYDSKAPSLLAPIALTDAVTIDTSTQGRYKGYTLSQDGSTFINKQAVMGANFSEGEYTDTDSVTDPLASNYVGQVIEGKVIKDNTLFTNAECAARAKELVEQSNRDKRTWATATYVEIDPLILYEPRALSFDQQYEPGLPDNLAVVRAALSFPGDGMAQFDLTLGDPVLTRTRKWPVRKGQTQALATVSMDARGQVQSVGPPTSQRYYGDFNVQAGGTFTHAADASGAPVTASLPPAAEYPGAVVAIKKLDTSGNAVTVAPYDNSGTHGQTVDTVDEGTSYILSQPGQTVMLQSEATTGNASTHGANWHVLSSAGDNGTSWVQGGNSFGELGVLRTNDDFDLALGANDIDWARITADGALALYGTNNVSGPHVGEFIEQGRFYYDGDNEAIVLDTKVVGQGLYDNAYLWLKDFALFTRFQSALGRNDNPYDWVNFNSNGRFNAQYFTIMPETPLVAVGSVSHDVMDLQFEAHIDPLDPNAHKLQNVSMLSSQVELQNAQWETVVQYQNGMDIWDGGTVDSYYGAFLHGFRASGGSVIDTAWMLIVDPPTFGIDADTPSKVNELYGIYIGDFRPPDDTRHDRAWYALYSHGGDWYLEHADFFLGGQMLIQNDTTDTVPFAVYATATLTVNVAEWHVNGHTIKISPGGRVDAEGFKTAGVSGVDGTFTAGTSTITVQGGIITGIL